jgi:hypothetical protein
MTHPTAGKNPPKGIFFTGVTVTGSALLHTKDLSVFLLTAAKGCPSENRAGDLTD